MKSQAKKLIDLIDSIIRKEKLLDEIMVFDAEKNEAHRIDEGKWVPTKTSNTMRIDHATHGVGQTHAHIYGRKGTEIGVVNFDGTASHGKKMTLSKKDTETLRDHGFAIPSNRIVEWIIRRDLTRQLLLEEVA